MTYSGARKTVLIGQESVYGTPVSADKDVGLVQDITDGYTREINETMGLGAVETQQITSGNFKVAGSFSYNFQHGRMLEFAFGGVTTHLETTGDWTHTFVVSGVTNSFTLESSEDGTTDTARTYEGCVVEKTEISIAQTGNLTVKQDWKGETVVSTSTAAAAVLDNLIVFPKSLVTISINSIAAVEIQDFSMSINRTVQQSEGISTVFIQQTHVTEMKFEYSGKLGFQNVTPQELGYGGSSPVATPTSFEVELDATNGTALGSGLRRLNLILENCVHNKFEVSATIGDLIFINFSGNGTFQGGTSVDDISNVNWL